MMTDLPPRIAAWAARGNFAELPQARIWHAAVGPADQCPPVLVLHGFPTSSYDARRVMAELPRRRFIALDLPGYGLSAKPAHYGYSLFEQADIVCQLAQRLGLREVLVWAHDMGTSVLTELLARRER